MERNESTCVIVGHQNSVVSLVNVKQARLKILRDLYLIRIRLNFIHFLDLLLFSSALNLVAFIPFLKLLDLLVMKFLLRSLALLVINSLLNILRAETRGLNPTLVHVPAHIGRVFADRLALFVIGSLHFLVSLFVTLRKRV